MILTIKLDDFNKVKNVKVTQKINNDIEEIRLIYYGQRGTWHNVKKNDVFDYLKVYTFHNMQVREKLAIHKSRNKEKAINKAINNIIGYDLY